MGCAVKFIKTSTSVAYFAIALVVLAGLVRAVFFGDVGVYDENNLLENTQAVILALSFLMFLMPILNSGRRDRLLAAFFAMLALGFILRELDVERLNVPNLLVLLGSGDGRNILLATGFSCILVIALFNFRYYLNLASCFLRARVGVTAMVAGIFLVLGDTFESIDITHNVLFEESLELMGYAFFLAASSSLARREVRSDRFIR